MEIIAFRIERNEIFPPLPASPLIVRLDSRKTRKLFLLLSRERVFNACFFLFCFFSFSFFFARCILDAIHETTQGRQWPPPPPTCKFKLELELLRSRTVILYRESYRRRCASSHSPTPSLPPLSSSSKLDLRRISRVTRCERKSREGGDGVYG